MRTSIFPLIAFILFSSSVSAQTQSAIYDAATIVNARHGVAALLVPNASGFDIIDPVSKKRLTSNENHFPDSLVNNSKANEVILAILRRNANLTATSSQADVEAAYSANPFLNDIFRSIVPLGFTASDLRTVNNYNAPALSAGIGRDLGGNLVNGTADFLIKRGQEELSIHVFQRLKTFLNRYPEFESLFPSTCALIKPIEAYEYNKALTAFRSAIKQDMDGFVTRIPTLYNIPRYKLLNQKVPSLTLVFGATTVVNGLHGKHGVATIVQTMGSQPYLAEENNYASFLKVVALLSNSLLNKTVADPDGGEVTYIHREFIKNVTKDYQPVLLAQLSKVYLGLIWQQTKDLPVYINGSRKTFNDLLGHWATQANIGEAVTKLEATMQKLQFADSVLRKLKEDELNLRDMMGRTDMRAERFAHYSQLVSSILSLSDIYLSSTVPDASRRIREITTYLPRFTDATSAMIKNFHEEEYSLGLSKLGEVMEVVLDYLETTAKDKTASENLFNDLKTTLEADRLALGNRKADLETRISHLSRPGANANENAAKEAEKQELAVQLKELEGQLEQIDHQLKKNNKAIYNLAKVIRHINLLAAITKAENSDAVRALLETHALPAGSSRIKKVSRVNFAVNAYIGGFFLRSSDLGEGFTNTYGLTAPIGFTLSTGFKRSGSLSLFTGVFDIGSTVRYKLDNEGKYHQEVSLAGVVSPSVHVVYGFPWYVPLSIGAGCQWTSPTTSTSSKISLKPSFNMFLAVDIPLFNLANGRIK